MRLLCQVCRFRVWHAGFRVSCPASIHGELVALAPWSWYAACYSTFTCWGSNTWSLQSTRALHVTFTALKANVAALAFWSLRAACYPHSLARGCAMWPRRLRWRRLLSRHRGFTTRARLLSWVAWQVSHLGQAGMSFVGSRPGWFAQGLPGGWGAA